MALRLYPKQELANLGGNISARINSIISTVSKHGLNAFSELVNIFNRNIPAYMILCR